MLQPVGGVALGSTLDDEATGRDDAPDRNTGEMGTGNL